jgi:hypothetical protein
MMFVHGTKADVLGASLERRDCQRNFGEPRNDLEAWEPYCLGREGRRDGHTGSPHCMLRTTWPEEPLVAKQSGKQERI